MARLTTGLARQAYIRDVGPRSIGGLYGTGAQDAGRVVGIHYGPQAETAAGRDTGWAITELGADGLLRTHSTSWATAGSRLLATPAQRGWVYRVSCMDVPMRHYLTPQEARQHVVSLLRNDGAVGIPVWIPVHGGRLDPQSPVTAQLLDNRSRLRRTAYAIVPIPNAEAPWLRRIPTH